MSRLVVDNQNYNKTLKYTLLSATVLALANIGDAFLYAYLPANYQNIGISIIWVGVILSINRFTRLLFNGWVAYYLSEKGIRIVTIITAIIASLTTVLYGFISSVFLWLIVRILWGISFSTLRLGSIVYALQYKKRGIALGLNRAIIELGAVFALIIGPVLLEYFDRTYTFYFLGLISFCSILIAIILPNIKTELVSKKDLILSFPSSFNTMVLSNAIIVEGILVVLTSRLVQMEYHLSPGESLVEVGFLLGYRRLCLVVFSPLAGWLADKIGVEKIFVYSTILLTLGILLIAFKLEIIGLITTFTFGAMNASIAIGGAINKNNSYLKEVSDNTTWRDIGTALGSLVGAILLTSNYIYHIFLLATTVLISTLINHYFKKYKGND